MIKTFAVDENNDLFLNAIGNISIISDLEAVLQIAERSVKTQLGELLYNTDRGIPNFDLAWKGTPNLPQYEAALRRTLLSISSVTEVIRLNIIIKADMLEYSAEIATVFGTGEVNGSL